MKCMRYVLVAFAFFLFIPLAFSQEAVIKLDHRELGGHQRPAVNFPHEEHAGKIECMQCHHDFDQYMNNRGGEDKAQSCAACHGKEKKLPSLTDAFHGQCKGCHEAMAAKAKPAGPVTCGGCHVKK